ncbi:hypothetical protein HYH03_007355 [Edaphochlamys debaryana]|uniref:Nucleoside phosphorylase domain-containing protein n=1 Tax=Edaphochlamys debaryana TaxID=47281 RepID=A0A836C0L1_9CHLO|nr:hypothetical protein HYH03_007355 [Edaphochlamys debaryana]|eukprot:KAG2494589.1 hypothetical protein HYH03_007355 [Edaphochlamys debaryana]
MQLQGKGARVAPGPPNQPRRAPQPLLLGRSSAPAPVSRRGALGSSATRPQDHAALAGFSRPATLLKAQEPDHAESPSAVIGRLKPIYRDANFPTDAQGRTYHLGTREGEVAPRILSVGTVTRAQLVATLLQPPAPGRQLFQRVSSRGFHTITGRFEGVPVSIVSTHMGMPNMDFVVRENRAVVRGQMAIVRLGTCGAVQHPAKLGDLLVASHGSIAVRRDADYWSLLERDEHQPSARTANGGGSSNGHTANGHAANGHGPAPAAPDVCFVEGPSALAGRRPYSVSLPVRSDPYLASILVEAAAAVVGPGRVVQGLTASADSFYSSQGRTGPEFDDANEGLLGALTKAHPDLMSLEMETFHLMDLARCSKGSIRATGICVALAERYSNEFMEYSKLPALELAGGTAALRALAGVPLREATGEELAAAAAKGVQYVWE